MQEKKRILAVDDASINLAVIVNALSDTYEVITANSGERVLKYLSKERPDLILLDIRMEHMDGIETLRKIREMENGAAIPVIMLTSAHDKDSVVESSKLGIYDYILKPFEPKDLKERIRAALAQAEKRQCFRDKMSYALEQMRKRMAES